MTNEDSTTESNVDAAGTATMRVSTRLAVVNPASCSGRTAKRWPALEAKMRERGLDVVAKHTTAQGDATQIVADFIDGGGREIVVCGGDGTLNEVVAGCVKDGSPRAQGIVLSIIHQGTGGDLARGLGIPKATDEAIDTALHGALKLCDAGLATFHNNSCNTEQRAFISCANVGMGADVVQRATGNLKKIGASGSFAVAAVTHLLTNKPRKVHITIDEESSNVDIVDIMIANNRYVGGGMFVAPQAKIDDGLLDVVIIGAAGKTKLITTFPKIYKGTHVNDPIVRCATTQTVAIDAPVAQGVVLDGELVGTTPARFDIIPGALSIRVPRHKQ